MSEYRVAYRMNQATVVGSAIFETKYYFENFPNYLMVGRPLDRLAPKPRPDFYALGFMRGLEHLNPDYVASAPPNLAEPSRWHPQPVRSSYSVSNGQDLDVNHQDGRQPSTGWQAGGQRQAGAGHQERKNQSQTPSFERWVAPYQTLTKHRRPPFEVTRIPSSIQTLTKKTKPSDYKRIVNQLASEQERAVFLAPKPQASQESKESSPSKPARGETEKPRVRRTLDMLMQQEASQRQLPYLAYADELLRQQGTLDSPGGLADQKRPGNEKK